ncbi:MAG TPA: DUF2157 domain-containing protein [Gammaproteobacteria bacterium]
MSNATPRRTALDEVVRLARAHGLSVEEIAAALGEAAPEATDARAAARASALARLFAYVGATFVFAGVAIFIAIRWGRLDSAARVVATLGSGLAAFAMACAATRDARFEKAATPLFVIAAVLEPFGILVALDEYASGDDWRYAVLAACFAVGAQQLAVFAALRRTDLLFLGVLFGAGFAATGMDLLGMSRELIAFVVGVSLVSFAVAAEQAGRGAVAPYWYFVGASSLLAGFFGLVEGTPVEPVFVGAAAACIYASTLRRSRALLIVGVVAMLAYIGYFTADRFADAVGWPLALIAFGLALLALSAWAVRLDRRYIARGT